MLEDRFRLARLKNVGFTDWKVLIRAKLYLFLRFQEFFWYNEVGLGSNRFVLSFSIEFEVHGGIHGEEESCEMFWKSMFMKENSQPFLPTRDQKRWIGPTVWTERCQGQNFNQFLSIYEPETHFFHRLQLFQIGMCLVSHTQKEVTRGSRSFLSIDWYDQFGFVVRFPRWEDWKKLFVSNSFRWGRSLRRSWEKSDLSSWCWTNLSSLHWESWDPHRKLRGYQGAQFWLVWKLGGRTQKANNINCLWEGYMRKQAQKDDHFWSKWRRSNSFQVGGSSGVENRGSCALQSWILHAWRLPSHYEGTKLKRKKFAIIATTVKPSFRNKERLVSVHKQKKLQFSRVAQYKQDCRHHAKGYRGGRVVIFCQMPWSRKCRGLVHEQSRRRDGGQVFWLIFFRAPCHYVCETAVSWGSPSQFFDLFDLNLVMWICSILQTCEQPRFLRSFSARPSMKQQCWEWHGDYRSSC